MKEIFNSWINNCYLSEFDISGWLLAALGIGATIGIGVIQALHRRKLNEVLIQQNNQKVEVSTINENIDKIENKINDLNVNLKNQMSNTNSPNFSPNLTVNNTYREFEDYFKNLPEASGSDKLIPRENLPFGLLTELRKLSMAEDLHQIHKFGSSSFDKDLKEAEILYYQGKFHQALKIYDELLSQNNQNPVVLANKAIMHRQLGQLAIAIEFHLKSAKHNSQNKNFLELARNYNDLGITLRHSGLLYKGLISFLYSYYYNEKTEKEQDVFNLKDVADNKTRIAKNIYNLALVSRRLGDLHLSSMLHKRALSLNQVTNDRTRIAMNLNGIAMVERELGNSKDSKKVLFESLKIHQDLDIKLGMARNNVNIALAELDTARLSKEHQEEQYEKSEAHLLTAFSIYELHNGINAGVEIKAGQAKCFNVYGLWNKSKGDSEAFDYYFDNKVDKKIRIKTKNTAQKYYEIAIKNYLQALEINYGSIIRVGIAKNYNNLGRTVLSQYLLNKDDVSSKVSLAKIPDVPKAVEALQKVSESKIEKHDFTKESLQILHLIEQAEKLEIRDIESLAKDEFNELITFQYSKQLTNITDLQEYLKENSSPTLDKALVLFDKSLDIHNIIENNAGIARNCFSISLALLMTNNPNYIEKSIEFLKHSIDIYSHLKLVGELKRNLKDLRFFLRLCKTKMSNIDINLYKDKYLELVKLIPTNSNSNEYTIKQNESFEQFLDEPLFFN